MTFFFGGGECYGICLTIISQMYPTYQVLKSERDKGHTAVEFFVEHLSTLPKTQTSDLHILILPVMPHPS